MNNMKFVYNISVTMCRVLHFLKKLSIKSTVYLIGQRKQDHVSLYRKDAVTLNHFKNTDQQKYHYHNSHWSILATNFTFQTNYSKDI